jgi:hypothetical protein
MARSPKFEVFGTLNPELQVAHALPVSLTVHAQGSGSVMAVEAFMRNAG